MEKSDVQESGPRYWAWGISLAAHVFLLSILGVFTFQSRPERTRSAASTFTIDQVREILRTEPITPKPKLKPLVSGTAAEPVLSAAPMPPEPDFPIHPPAAEFETAASEGVVEFFGQRSGARKICYVVDCSGSMFGRMEMVRSQLRSSIGRLRPDQYFSILFLYKDGQIAQSGDGFLRRATARVKSQAGAMIDAVQPEGRAESLRALRTAMELCEPGGSPVEVIYFLTDGFDLEEPAGHDFSRQVENLRKTLAPGCVIHTIGFWAAEEDRRILRTIAAQSGGGFVSME